MKWILFLIIIAMLASILEKLDSLLKKVDSTQMNNKNVKKTFSIDSYINKEVCIEIDNDDVYNSHLFSPMYNTTGKIVDYDNEWLVFEYLDKSKNSVVDKYFRIKDIVSINEIK